MYRIISLLCGIVNAVTLKCGDGTTQNTRSGSKILNKGSVDASPYHGQKMKTEIRTIEAESVKENVHIGKLLIWRERIRCESSIYLNGTKR